MRMAVGLNRILDVLIVKKSQNAQILHKIVKYLIIFCVFIWLSKKIVKGKLWIYKEPSKLVIYGILGFGVS